MRELKFRYWNPYVNELFHNPIVFGSTLEGYFSSLGWTWEQYTGLKDKNDREIYDGDIVEEDIDFNSETTDGAFRYRVYWDECLLCWALDPIGEESIHDELWQTNLSRRVIGNIHENPELLEEE